MALHLTIDIGNSSTKAALWSGSELAAPIIRGDLYPHDIEQLCDGFPVDCAAVCSVADDSRGLTRAASNVSKRLIKLTADTPSPVDVSAYLTPHTLGADRIAAMAGALAICPGRELLVIDCGTAVTYDRVSAQGHFLGGNIAPGLGMRLRSLYEFTAKLPLVDTSTDAPIWGLNTQQALQSGAYQGLLAEIDHYRRLAPEAQVVLTGGRARDLALIFPAIIDTDLVLRGLNNIIEYNENH